MFWHQQTNFDDALLQATVIARQVLKSDEDTTQILTQVYEYVWNHASEYDPAHQAILPWLIVITKKFSLHHLSRRDFDALGLTARVEGALRRKVAKVIALMKR